jgi:hypothetical protein
MHSTWSTFGPDAIGAERFATVFSGTSFVQVARAILQERARVQNPDKDEVSSPVCDRSTLPYWAAGRDPGLPGDDASEASQRHRRAGRWSGLSGQIAADLLPEAGDSRTADGGEAV